MAQTTFAPTRRRTTIQNRGRLVRRGGAYVSTLPPADMQSLMTQLGAAAPNTAITGSSVGLAAPKR